MKKSTLLIALLAASLGLYGQKTESDSLSISRTALSKTKSIYDLDKRLPKDAKIKSLEVVAKVDGKVRISQAHANEWSKETRNILDSADKGTKIYIDFSYSVPPAEKLQLRTIVVKVQ